MPLRIGLAALAILSLTAISAHTGAENPAQAGEATKQPEVQVRGPIVATATMVDFDEQFAMEQEHAWNVGVWERGVAEAAWNQGVWDAGVARAAAEAAARAAPRQVSGGYAPVAVSGDCAPVAAIIGWGIVNRESGGNPGAVNSSSGAFGCSQTLPSHYNPGGSCAGMDMYSVEGQTQCTQKLYDQGGLNPWRLTA